MDNGIQSPILDITKEVVLPRSENLRGEKCRDFATFAFICESVACARQRGHLAAAISDEQTCFSID